MSLSSAAASLKKHHKFVITAHVNLEGDALGSELAVCRLLKKMGKKAVIVNADPVPYGYGFLPEISAIRLYKKGMKRIPFDCFVVLDCSDITRPGEVSRLNDRGVPVLNVDHHVSNRRFGDVNWVDPEASSCTEMVYRLYKECGVPFDKKSALFLYAGIMTDTGSFRYSNTTAQTHRITAHLISCGLDVNRIYRSIYGSIPYPDIKLLLEILPSMRREAGGRIIWFELKHSLLEGRKLSFDLSEHILAFARSVKGVEVVALFREGSGPRPAVRLNLRSQGSVNVNKVAASFGGGGHPTASGAVIPGSLDSVRRRVLRKIREVL